jgi:hypothetical protein
MALETAFKEVNTQMRSLHDVFLDLRLAIVDERPAMGDPVLVDVFGDVADDLLAWLSAALICVGKGTQAARHPTQLGEARRHLVSSQEQFNNISHRFWSNLNSYERVSELVYLGRDRGGDWLVWAHTVKERLERCRQPLYSTNLALFRCWKELTEWC